MQDNKTWLSKKIFYLNLLKSNLRVHVTIERSCNPIRGCVNSLLCSKIFYLNLLKSNLRAHVTIERLCNPIRGCVISSLCSWKLYSCIQLQYTVTHTVYPYSSRTSPVTQLFIQSKARHPLQLTMWIKDKEALLDVPD